jgi:hypothetical protein
VSPRVVTAVIILVALAIAVLAGVDAVPRLVLVLLGAVMFLLIVYRTGVAGSEH